MMIPNGIWQGELLRKDGHIIPFNFETRNSDGKKIIYIHNGPERLLVNDIRIKGDSVFIEMPFFDSRFSLQLHPDMKLTGNWIKNYGQELESIPFLAVFNEPRRFNITVPPTKNISGRWEVHFKGGSGASASVGEFLQNGWMVQGTILNPTGDFRYLEGVVDGDTLRLSTFDGGHAFAFESKILNDSLLSDGYFYSGANSKVAWEAIKNDQAKLSDEFNVTHIKDALNPMLHFRFPDLNGRLVSLSDSAFKNKVVIVQIMGSWCPNCMDETQFLAPYYTENKKRGVEIVALAYERTTSITNAKRLLQTIINRFHVGYPILFTGVTNNDSLKSEKTIPEIQQIVGFPTTVFIDKKGRVRKIHTGFSGPGTGEHYEILKNKFTGLIDLLLNENPATTLDSSNNLKGSAYSDR